MKTTKYLIWSLLIAFAVAGCAGSTGGANFDQGDILRDAVETENYQDS